MTDYARLQHSLRVIPKTQTPSWNPGLYVAHGGTHPQDGLADQHAGLAGLTKNSSKALAILMTPEALYDPHSPMVGLGLMYKAPYIQTTSWTEAY